MEQGARRRRMPAWGWVLVGIAGLILAIGAGGYAAYVNGVLPAVLDLMAVPYVAAYLPAAAAALVALLLLAALIGYATSGKVSARGSRDRSGRGLVPAATAEQSGMALEPRGGEGAALALEGAEEAEASPEVGMTLAAAMVPVSVAGEWHEDKDQ